MSTDLFNAIASRYDVTNHVLSFGMDPGWRRKMLHFLPKGEKLSVLDLATGTGDVAIPLGQSASVAKVTGIDVAQGMLLIGRKKVNEAGLGGRISLRQGDAMAIDSADAQFDAVTVAFGVRNFPDLMKGLMEAWRVLKPGGAFIILEFAQPSGLARYCHRFYLKRIVPLVGALVTGNFKAYAYLSSTILVFPYGKRFVRIMRQTGFEKVGSYALAFGAAMIYVGHKRADI